VSLNKTHLSFSASAADIMSPHEDAWPLMSANRHVYDSPVPFPPEVAKRIATLEAELAALRSSTSWRITYPLRYLVAAIRKALPGKQVAPTAGNIVSLPSNYLEWIDLAEAERRSRTRAQTGQRRVYQPRLGLVLIGALAEAELDPPTFCQVLALPEGSGQIVIDQALSKLSVDYVCFLDAADRLATHALSLVEDILAREPHLDIVFADEDWLDAEGNRTQPFLKPGWDPELQRGRDLIGPFVMLRSCLLPPLNVACGPAWRYELASRVAIASRPERIRHVPEILCHRTAKPEAQDKARLAVAQAMLAEAGLSANVQSTFQSAGLQRVIYLLPAPPPQVSIIVPSRDRADLLDVCASGILNRTNYDHLELLIVDNGTSEPDALALLDSLGSDHRVRVLRRPGPFNWSALNNSAARAASGEILVLLNNDIAVRDPEWLTELVSHAMQPRVGVVGAKLLYPDGRIQHAGLSTEFTKALPRHVLRFAVDNGGPCGLLSLAREVWGVTGACMALRRSVFFSAGGLNEALAVSCNDVDFCVRLRALGYRIIWTPWAELTHHELASRGDDVTPEQQARAREEHHRLRRDWGNLMRDDPHYPPALDSRSEVLPYFYGNDVARSTGQPD
jgi:GT2 family glycosyltransferase